VNRVLLVEDEPLVRELAFEDLTDAGWQVTAARDGDEALCFLKAGQGFDLLFTDIRMPGATDGWELARRAKEMIAGLKVIYASGLDGGGRKLEAEERHLDKPYSAGDLNRVLADLGFAAAGA